MTLQGRGVCRRGFCHCEKGWWGRDCGRSRAYGAHSALRAVHKLRVYAYDLPWQVSGNIFQITAVCSTWPGGCCLTFQPPPP
jgi:hypothetical protein